MRRLDEEVDRNKLVGPSSDGPGEQEKADFLRNYLSQIGFKHVSSYSAPDDRVMNGERPNLVAVLPGNNSEKTLWILSHTDIVPAGDLSKWETDPFDPVVNNGKIFGRGSEDNHQGIVSSVMMARAFIETGIQPATNIGLVFIADEETGNEYGYRLSQMVKATQWSPIFCVAKPISTDLFFHPWST